MLVCWCVGDWSSKMLVCWCVGDLELKDAIVLVCG